MSDINQLVLETLQPQSYRNRVEVVIKKGDKILLSVIGAYTSKVTKPYYGLPGGGIEVGDSAVKTCQKECLEEVGVKIKNIKKIPIKSFKFKWAKRTITDTADYSKELQKRIIQYKGSLTDYYIADFDKVDLSKYGGVDGQTTEYVFVSIPEAISLIERQIKTPIDSKNIPIPEYRLKVLKLL